MRKYKRPINTYCKLYAKQAKMEVADLESEMYEVLYKCVVSYDPDAGASFNTYVWQGIYNRFRTILARNGTQKRSGIEIPFNPLVDIDFSEEDGGDEFSYMVSLLSLAPSAEEVAEARETIRQRLSSYV